VITGKFSAIRELLWIRYFTCCDNPQMPTIEQCKARGCRFFKDSKISNWRQRCWERDEAVALRKVQEMYHRSVVREMPAFDRTLPLAELGDLYLEFIFNKATVTKTMATGARRYAEARWPQLSTK